MTAGVEVVHVRKSSQPFSGRRVVPLHFPADHVQVFHNNYLIAGVIRPDKLRRSEGTRVEGTTKVSKLLACC